MGFGRPPQPGTTRIATARAGSNIAFIKYWGVGDVNLNLPLNNSISMTLGDLYTTTTVEWLHPRLLGADEVSIDGRTQTGKAAERVVRQLDRIRAQTGSVDRARVVSRNNFPIGSGIASSASGFAALTVAGCAALGVNVERDRLSALARRGSGSAARSIYGGYVEWERGTDDRTSIAHQLYPADHWPLLDIVAVVNAGEKSVSSEDGHRLAMSSPFNGARIGTLPAALSEVRAAIATRDLQRMGPIIEQDALAMHAVMMTSSPSLVYWQGGTVDLINAVRRWRTEGIPAYFTIDAGPNVHIICEEAQRTPIMERLRTMSNIQQIIVSGPGDGPRLLDTHMV
jgi:diphosphomevalonate decarboxylase